MNRTSWWVSGCLALVLGWACGGDDGESASTSCTQGAEKCGCYANGTCDGSLRCLSNVCVAPNRPSGSAGAGFAGSAGAEHEPLAGGSDSGGASTTASGGSSKGGTVASGGTLGSGGRTASGGSAGSDKASGGDVGVSAGGAGGVPPTGAAGSAGESVLSSAGAGGAALSNGGETGGGGVPVSEGGAAQGGAPGTGVVLFSDDFEDGDLSGWTAPSWMTFSDGNNEVLRQNPDYTGATTPARAGSSSWGDRRMEVSFKFAQAGVSFAVLGSVFEGADDRDQIMIDASGSGTLLHAVGGVITSDTFSRSLAVGTWYRLGFEIDGTTLRGYFDGELVAELENVGGVKGGVAVAGTQNGEVYYDDVLVTTLP